MIADDAYSDMTHKQAILAALKEFGENGMSAPELRDRLHLHGWGKGSVNWHSLVSAVHVTATQLITEGTVIARRRGRGRCFFLSP